MNKEKLYNLFQKMEEFLEVKPGDVIKATKISDNHQGSIKVGDVCTGVLESDIKIGEGVCLRSQYCMSGLKTTRVVSISKFCSFLIAETEHSVYVIEKMGNISDIE